MKFEINNTEVYGIDFSIKSSGNPLRTYIDKSDVNDNDIKRAKKLGNVKSGTGHDCFLKGIVVNFDISAPLYMWKQIQRYTFLDFISSQSTMHCITKFDIKKQCNDYVFPETIKKLEELVTSFNDSNDKETWYKIVSNIPSGFFLTASLTTNYLQLKTIYNQRKNHKLKEWHLFCDWCLDLPYFKEFVLNNEK